MKTEHLPVEKYWEKTRGIRQTESWFLAWGSRKTPQEGSLLLNLHSMYVGGPAGRDGKRPVLAAASGMGPGEEGLHLWKGEQEICLEREGGKALKAKLSMKAK